MRLSFCAVCGDSNIEYHHWLPISEGGLDVEDNILSLCPKHHGEVHSMRRRSDISELTKKGMARAKKRGVKFGQNAKKLKAASIAAKIEFAESIKGFVEEAINSVKKITYQNVSNKLNEMGVKSRRGCVFYACTTRNIVKCLNLSHHFKK